MIEFDKNGIPVTEAEATASQRTGNLQKLPAPPHDISSARISKCCLFALVTVIVTVCVFASFEV